MNLRTKLLQKKNLVGGVLAIIIMAIALLSIKFISSMNKPPTLNPGVYAEVIKATGVSFDFYFLSRKTADGGSCHICLIVKNNSAQVINIATPDKEWRLYKQTDTGWQPFYGHWINRFDFQFIKYTPQSEFIEPGREKVYWAIPLTVLGTSNQNFDPYTLLSQQWETPMDGGNFILQLAYTTVSTEGVVTRTTYTPSFAFKQALSSTQPISITISPQVLTKKDGTSLVQLEITNRTNQVIWLRPLGLSIRSLFGPDIHWIRKVDETSWEYVDLPKEVRDYSNSLISVEAQSTRRLQGEDFNTDFEINQAGTYRWVVPIWLEYLPKGHGYKQIGDPDVPFLNQQRYVFSEELEIR